MYKKTMQNTVTTTIKNDLAEVESIIEAQFAENSLEFIAEVGQHLFKNGGKRLRPKLLVTAARNLSFDAPNSHYMAAVIELMHTATLLHDDVIDLSPLRRNQVTAHEIWGNKTSILVGDFMFTRALELTARHANQNWGITELLAQTLNQITVGEMLQLRNHGNFALDEETYFKIIESKTAILFATACETAALLANAQKETQEALRAFGHNLGMAFQVIDDILDYTSQAEVMGKAVGDDLAEGKATIPLIHLLASASDADKAVLTTHLEQKSREPVDAIVKMMYQYESIEYATKIAKEFIDNALSALSMLPQNDYQTELEKITFDALYRIS